MIYTMLEQIKSTVKITAEQFQPLVDALTGTYSVSNILTIFGIGVSTVGAVVLTIWGVKKIIVLFQNSMNGNISIEEKKEGIRQAYYYKTGKILEDEDINFVDLV